MSVLLNEVLAGGSRRISFDLLCQITDSNSVSDAQIVHALCLIVHI